MTYRRGFGIKCCRQVSSGMREQSSKQDVKPKEGCGQPRNQGPN